MTLRVLYVTLLVACVVALAVVVAVVTVKQLNSSGLSPNDIKLLCGTLTVGGLVSTYGRVRTWLSKARAFIQGDGDQASLGEHLEISLILAAVLLSAVRPLAPEGGEQPRDGVRSLVALSLIDSDGVTFSKADRIAIPFFHRKVSGCTPEGWEGASVDDAARIPLAELGCALRSCGAKIDVIGFASERVFDHCPDSDGENIELSALRRRSVLTLLRDGTDGARCSGLPPLDVEDREDWKSRADMERFSEWKDSSPGGEYRYRELLTRRVDIRIVHKGQCAAAATSQAKVRGP